MRVLMLFVCGLVLGCGDSKARTPSGTAADPVEVCKRAGDVCRIGKAKLGVCTQAEDGTGFTCTSQH